MDDTESKAGPTLSEDVQELQGKFSNHTALEDAISRLTLQGFDHADFSMPDPNAPAGTPDTAEAVADEIDLTQVRTMASGMTGAAAGTGVAAVLLATGGLAVPLVAVAAGMSALGAAAATTGVGVARDQAGLDALDRLGAEGKLILAVRVRSPEKQDQAEAAMREAGATEITAVVGAENAMTRGVSSASWTGG